jgi:hypothetical protein
MFYIIRKVSLKISELRLVIGLIIIGNATADTLIVATRYTVLICDKKHRQYMAAGTYNCIQLRVTGFHVPDIRAVDRGGEDSVGA